MVKQQQQANTVVKSDVTAYFQKKKLIIPYTTAQQMLALCNSNDYTEFQWFLQSELVKTHAYKGFTGDVRIIEDSFAFPKQVVTATVVKSEPEYIAQMLEENEGTFNVWCHSHVDMACRPSNRDMTEIREQAAGLFNPDDYVIMLITNKRGECYAEFHQAGFSYPMQIEIEEGNIHSAWAAEISNRYITVEPIKTPYNPQFSNNRRIGYNKPDWYFDQFES